MTERPYNIIQQCEHGSSPGITLLAHIVLNRAGINPDLPVTILDWDLRAATIDVMGIEYRIRTWNIHDDKANRRTVTEWTLYRRLAYCQRSERVIGGTTVLTYDELIAERDRLDKEEKKTQNT